MSRGCSNERTTMHEVAWSSSPNDLWNLFHLRPITIRFIYCDEDYWGSDAIKWESVRTRRKKFRRLAEKGVIDMPRRTEKYEGPDAEREAVRSRRSKNAPKVGEAALAHMVSEADRQRLHKQLDQLIDDANLPPDVIKQIRIKKISTWQMGYKDGDNEAQSHPLVGLQLEAEPRKFQPQWPPIAPVALEKPLKRKEAAKPPSGVETTVIPPDLQYPFVDERALDVFYQICAVAKPENIVQLGDALDMTAYSRFIDSKIYAETTQQALVDTLKFFAALRRLVPAAKIVYLEGNHEQRLPKDILGNHRHNYSLRSADNLDGDPLLSIPSMLGLKSVGVEYLPGYPNNRYWVNDRLQIVHGTKTGRNEAKRVLTSEKVSTIYGHTHRLNHEVETINHRSGAEYRHSYGAGCLSRLDTQVPSTNSGYDLSGNPIGGHHENWQHGFLVVTHDNDNFFVEQVLIDTFNGYKTLFRGRVYEPRV